ncbi:MAG: hypothetical protein Kow00103_03470 [Candidatus Caldatribacteriota bacterium]
MIIDARLALINFNPEKKRILYPTTPVKARIINRYICDKFIEGIFLNFIKNNIIKKREAKKNLKKAEV